MMSAQRTALAATAAVILTATALSGACVEKDDPCEEIDAFADIYSTDCPAIDAWSTQCASNLQRMLPEARQDFDWCVECYLELNDSPDLECTDAPLGENCSDLLNTTLDASCTWPTSGI